MNGGARNRENRGGVVLRSRTWRKNTRIVEVVRACVCACVCVCALPRAAVKLASLARKRKKREKRKKRIVVGRSLEEKAGVSWCFRFLFFFTRNVERDIRRSSEASRARGRAGGREGGGQATGKDVDAPPVVGFGG